MFLALEGKGSHPLALQVARICKEFPCYGPREAEQALRDAPVGWFDEVIEARRFAETKAEYDRMKPEAIAEAIERDPWLDLVDDIAMTLEKERLVAERERETTP